MREQIETIHSRHPNGFKCNDDRPPSDSNEGTAAMDLMELKLTRHVTLKRAKRKLRGALMFMLMAFAQKHKTTIRERKRKCE